MSLQFFRRGLVVASAAVLATVTVTAAQAASPPGWHIADVLGPVGGSSQVSSVAATGTQDGWAAGSYCGSPCGSPDTPQILVAQWNGSAWQQVSLPASVTGAVPNPSAAFVGASSATNAWVFVQGTGTHSGTDYTYALDWNGSTWTSQRLAAWGLVNATEVFSPANAWAFGTQIGTTSQPYNLRYNGKTWRKVTLPGTVDSVSATSASNMWAFGSQASTAIVMHWNGKSWSTLSLPSLNLPPGESMLPSSIATLSATDVWVAGALSKGMGVASGYVLLHWNGTAWQRVTIPYRPFTVGHLAQDGQGGIWLSAYKDSGLTAYMYHDSGSGTWSEQKVPTETGNTPQVAALTWVPGTTSEWAGGELLPSDGSSQGAIFQRGS